MSDSTEPLTNLKRKRDSLELISTGHSNVLSAKLTLKLDTSQRQRKQLRIDIPLISLNSGLASPQNVSPTSLFSAASSIDPLFNDQAASSTISSPRSQDDTPLPALRTAPPIPGLFLNPILSLPQELADEVTSYCMKTYFHSPGLDQVMLFGRLTSDPPCPSSHPTSGLPPVLLSLLSTLSALLLPILPKATYELLFPKSPTRARQAIINLYHPGEGITPHIDLLGRYADGIIGVSFGSGCVMRFDKATPEHEASEDNPSYVRDANEERTRWDVYLPERSVIVLSEDARYNWTHGIEKKSADFVASSEDKRDLDEPQGWTSQPKGCWLTRGTRLSVTFRWLLAGADVLQES